jgi:hypothetical protein
MVQNESRARRGHEELVPRGDVAPHDQTGPQHPRSLDARVVASLRGIDQALAPVHGGQSEHAAPRQLQDLPRQDGPQHRRHLHRARAHQGWRLRRGQQLLEFSCCVSPMYSLEYTTSPLYIDSYILFISNYCRLVLFDESQIENKVFFYLY